MVGEDVVPEETGGGVGHSVAAGVGIAARPAAERLFEIVGGVGFVGPLMAVGTAHAAAVEVVEQHELFGHLVLVWRDFAAEQDEAGVAFAGFDVAEDLIVRAIFFDDVDDVLEDRRLAVALGDGTGRSIGPRRGEGVDCFGVAIVCEDLFCVGGEIVGRRQLDE